MCKKMLEKELSKLTKKFVGGIKKNKYAGIDYLSEEIIQACQNAKVNKGAISYCVQTLTATQDGFNYKIYPCFINKKIGNRYDIYCNFKKEDRGDRRYYKLVKAEPFPTI